MSSTYGLREGVSFCRIGGRSIFLDVDRDRYLALDPRLDTAFGTLVERSDIGQRDKDALVEAGILQIGGGTPLEPCTPGAATASIPPSCLISPAERRFTNLAKALISRARWTRRVRTRSLASNLETLATLRDALALSTAPAGALADIERAHRYAALVWSTAGRCLPTAMAIMSDLAHAGVHARLVFGVKLGPFGAHCWVEADGRPVGDDRENIERFVRIRVA